VIDKFCVICYLNRG